MSRVRALVTLLAVAGSGVAGAQPADPYAPAGAPKTPKKADAPQDPYAPAPGPAPAPAPAPGPAPAPAAPAAPTPQVLPPISQDPVLNEQVAQALVARAQELLDARVFLDAKQLAVEALVRSPKGGSADHARMIVHAVNQQLGIPEDAPKPEVDPTPIQDPTLLPKEHPVEPTPGALPSGKLSSSVHGALYFGNLGAMVGSFFSSSSPAKGAIPTGIGVGLAGALVTPWLTDKLKFSDAQVRTVGSGTTWGGLIGGLVADVGKLNGTTGREILVGSAIGSTVAGAGAYFFARENKLTRGDVALIDTFAGIGGVGGLTIGMLMQPAESEAYSLNSILGITGGVIVGMIAAPQSNTTPRRMLRVAGLAAAGGGLPFLLYAGIHDKSSNSDERLTGLLSASGLVLGTYLGFRWTAGMDDGLDTIDGKKVAPPADDAPLALVGRSSDGSWMLGGIGLQPLSPRLAPQPGMAVSLFGAAF